MNVGAVTGSPATTKFVGNVIGGEEREARGGAVFEKRSPATGEVISTVARSGDGDVDAAVTAARRAQPAWARRTVVDRGALLRRIAQLMERDVAAIAETVAAETGKSPADARGEVGAAVELGYFMAGEGRRYYGRTATSAIPNRQAMTIRQPLGVAGLIIAANTPIANVAWKVFPALVCGNGAVLKAAEDTPETALVFSRLAQEVELPAGVLNVVQGLGEEAGQPLVEHPDVDIVSFTGSAAVGRMIASVAGKRMAKVCLELGGKNPLIVCGDAELEGAAEAAALSAFSNAGQRCAAGSRIVVFDSVYDRFRELLLERTGALRVGPGDEDDVGPVINEGQLENMLAAVERAREAGADVIAGGTRLSGEGYDGGYYMAPTLVENAPPESDVACSELFGPIATLERVADFDGAIEAANATEYGLTAAIWTNSIHRAQEFLLRVRSGVGSINGPTYGSEPHMPFGGLGQSGNGWREPGTEALDVYSDLKTVYVRHEPELV
ncbi:MAG: aldehyde dehydrogenase family protein [Solirubrobacterales bacterium]